MGGGAIIVVGLGNPGKKYEHTPHNAGFKVVDELAVRCGCVLRRKLGMRAYLGKCAAAGKPLWLMKPATFMNNSGTAVLAALRKTGAPPSNLIVVLDDADLKPGQLRLRSRGGDGGHKGMVSIIERIGTEDFIRVRLGIGGAGPDSTLTEHVLMPMNAAERREMRQSVLKAADSVLAIIESGVDAAMNKFNV